MEKSIQDLKDEVEVLLQKYKVMEKRRRIARIVSLIVLVIVVSFFAFGAYNSLILQRGSSKFHIKYIFVSLMVTALAAPFMLLGVGFTKFGNNLFIIGNLSMPTISILFYILLALVFVSFAVHEYYVRQLVKIKDYATCTKRSIESKLHLKLQFEEEITNANSKTAKSIKEIYELVENAEEHDFY